MVKKIREYTSIITIKHAKFITLVGNRRHYYRTWSNVESGSDPVDPDIKPEWPDLVSTLVQGLMKQLFSGQANKPQGYVYREFWVTSGHKRKLLCEAQSACVA